MVVSHSEFLLLEVTTVLYTVHTYYLCICIVEPEPGPQGAASFFMLEPEPYIMYQLRNFEQYTSKPCKTKESEPEPYKLSFRIRRGEIFPPRARAGAASSETASMETASPEQLKNKALEPWIQICFQTFLSSELGHLQSCFIKSSQKWY
jgi:hypothetical protein